jgi:hypothetical protein
LNSLIQGFGPSHNNRGHGKFGGHSDRSESHDDHEVFGGRRGRRGGRGDNGGFGKYDNRGGHGGSGGIHHGFRGPFHNSDIQMFDISAVEEIDDG